MVKTQLQGNRLTITGVLTEPVVREIDPQTMAEIHRLFLTSENEEGGVDVTRRYVATVEPARTYSIVGRDFAGRYSERIDT